MRALLLLAGAARALTARHLLNGTCASLAKRLDDSFLVPRLEKALQAAKPPAVQVFANAAHSILLENFLCGLPRKDLRDHVVVWAADAETNGRMRRYLPSVRIVDVSSAFGDGEDAPFQSEAYAEFAAVKALMPHAAAALGFSTLTQDADVVWLADVPSYLRRFHAASMADSPRVDTRTRPCRRKEADLLRAYLETDKQRADHDASLLAKGKFVYDEEACRRHRCVDSVNGGFTFYKSGPVSTALAAWAGSCVDIVASRENQPALVNALKRTLPRDGCLYDEEARNTTTTTWPAPLTSQLVVLNQDLFVSGRRAAFAREALRRNELLAFHANFLYGWRAKCEKLRKLGLLFVDVAGGDVCRDPAAATCKSR
jgi:hypothetical protein